MGEYLRREIQKQEAVSALSEQTLRDIVNTIIPDNENMLKQLLLKDITEIIANTPTETEASPAQRSMSLDLALNFFAYLDRDEQIEAFQKTEARRDMYGRIFDRILDTLSKHDQEIAEDMIRRKEKDMLH